MKNETDTGMLLFGLAVLLGMGLLFWKITSGNTMTQFTRDSEGRIIEILERKI